MKEKSIAKGVIDHCKNLSAALGVEAYRALDPVTQELVREDLAKLTPFRPGEEIPALKRELQGNIRFRSIMKYRVLYSENSRAIRFFRLFLLIFPAAPGIEITGKIGGGLCIHHNCAVIYVERAGKNLTIGAFTVIGRKDGKLPVIGDDVTISANSTVVGGITIGDYALIGASSFVKKDVAGSTVVAGSPARLLRYRIGRLNGKNAADTGAADDRKEQDTDRQAQ